MKGKVVFVNFWATWCEPCRDEMGSMEGLNKTMAYKPFQVLSIVFNDDLNMTNLPNEWEQHFPDLAIQARN